MRLHTALLLGLAWGAGLPVLAQYKVVGPDGKVTYTDRPVAPPTGGQVQTLRAGSPPAAAANTALPLELRNVAARFPVTLYTGPDCSPCDTGRQLLQRRGIPFTEKLVSTDDDAAALQRITGGRSLPSLMVGTQALRGFLDSDWQGTLDLAGYPKESKLPRGWAAGPATPLVVRAAPADVVSAPTVRPTLPPEAAPAPAGGIRF